MHPIRYDIYAAMSLFFLRKCLKKALTQPPPRRPTIDLSKEKDTGEDAWAKSQVEAVQYTIDREILRSLVEVAKKSNRGIVTASQENHATIADTIARRISEHAPAEGFEFGRVHVYRDTHAEKAGEKVIRVDIQPTAWQREVEVHTKVSSKAPDNVHAICSMPVDQ